MSGTLLSARDARADKEEALLLELVHPAVRVGVVRVASVDDDVAFLEVGLELGDKVVDRLPGLYEEDDLPRALELLAEVLDRVGPDDVGSLCLVVHKVVDLADRSVVGDDGEALVILGREEMEGGAKGEEEDGQQHEEEMDGRLCVNFPFHRVTTAV